METIAVTSFSSLEIPQLLSHCLDFLNLDGSHSHHKCYLRAFELEPSSKARGQCCPFAALPRAKVS